MHEGKNIHLSPIDGKPLCSFSRKLCRQRRLHGYAFCIRHILEDTGAPFKQCQYQTKSGDTCINPVPITASRSYCNNHMNVLGLQPKTVKNKNNEKPSTNQSGTGKTAKKSTPSKAIIRRPRMNEQNKDQQSKKNEEFWPRNLGKKYENSKKRLEDWKAKERSKVFHDLLDKTDWLSQRNKNQVKSSSYRIHEIDVDEETQTIESFQTIFLTTNERVHHCTLRNDDYETQESKLVSKMKHQHAQLRHVFDQKMESGKLSYSVLSKLVTAAKEDATETANVINCHRNKSDQPIRIHCSPLEEKKYQVPCCMITNDERCTKPTLPYTRYCRLHINEDGDQLLFVPKNTSVPPTTNTSTLPKLKMFQTDISTKMNKTDINIHGKPVNGKRILAKKPNQRKRSDKRQIKRSAKKLTTKNSLKLKCIKEYGLYENMTSVKQNFHVKKKESVPESPTDLPVMGTPPVLSESSSSYTESDSDSDILTPEEAFHLPPGSLSFPTGLDDDDPLSGIHHSGRACDIVDEEDELIRCGTNFTMDTDKQDMISRELSSPTLNQLTDFDPSLGMFLSRNENNTELTHPSVVSSMNSDLHASSSTDLTSSMSNESTNVFREQSKQPEHFTSNTRFKPDSTRPVNHTTTKGAVTTLKISPLNMSQGQFSSTSIGFPSKQTVKPLLTNNYEQTPTNFTSAPLGVKPPILSTSIPAPTNSSNLVTINGHSGKNELCSWDKQYMQIDNFCESDMLNDMAMDEETPLEKVNPDIFFTSAFPVSSSTGAADL